MISLQIDVGQLIGPIFYFIFPSLDISEAHILQNMLYPVADTRKSEYSDTAYTIIQYFKSASVDLMQH